jgi:hypothetical protein
MPVRVGFRLHGREMAADARARLPKATRTRTTVTLRPRSSL